MGKKDKETLSGIESSLNDNSGVWVMFGYYLLNPSMKKGYFIKNPLYQQKRPEGDLFQF